MRYLLDAGHRRFAMIEGPVGWESVNDRSAGFSPELEAHGVSLISQLVSNGDWSSSSGHQVMCQHTETLPNVRCSYALVDLLTVCRLTDAHKDIQILLLRQQVRVLQ